MGPCCRLMFNAYYCLPQALLAADLCRLLRSNGLPTRILVHDHNFKHASSAVQTLRLARARLDGCVDGTAWHAYQGSPNDLNDEELTMVRMGHPASRVGVFMVCHRDFFVIRISLVGLLFPMTDEILPSHPF